MLNRVLEAQKRNEKISAIVSQVENDKETEFTVNKNGVCIIRIGFVYPMVMI